jgi:succinoglycan biosynthesis protein ExoA
VTTSTPVDHQSGLGDSGATSPKLPLSESVSVVIPCYNEEKFIHKALANLADQYDLSRYEIIVVDGMSEDQTREIIEAFKRSRPEVSISILDNSERTIPRALNIGIAAAQGEIIARMDAHAVPSRGYVRRCVEVLRRSGVGVVGTPCVVRPGAETPMARAVAAAVSHPFGIGDAKYRLGDVSQAGAQQQSVDTVAFGCFRKSLWNDLGGFNETLLTNEDYDFNYRVIRRGQSVLLDHAEHCDYFARTTLRDLATQYLRYGRWKARMVKRHPRSIKWRHLVAPAFALSLVSLTLLGVFWPPIRLLLGLEISLYALLSFIFGWRVMRRNQGGIEMLLLMPLIFLTIHLTWGSSFLLGLIRSPR